MIIECVGVIQWDHPAVFGPLSAAVVGGVCLFLNTLIKNNKPAGPPVELVLPDKDVGKELDKALDPHSARIEARIDALSEQMTQLAPKEPVPDSGDPLKDKAVEFHRVQAQRALGLFHGKGRARFAQASGGVRRIEDADGVSGAQRQARRDWGSLFP